MPALMSSRWLREVLIIALLWCCCCIVYPGIRARNVCNGLFYPCMQSLSMLCEQWTLCLWQDLSTCMPSNP